MRKSVTSTCPEKSDTRFWAKVRKDDNGCWLWTACVSHAGYGRFGLNGGYVLAHRYAYAREYGPIPDDRELHHTCETPACVNPAHLMLVTHREHNVLLTPQNFVAQQASQTHCVNGHEFTPENTYRWYKFPSQRCCRECRRLRSLALTEAHRKSPGFGRRNHPFFTCDLCGRPIRGKANLLKHLAACAEKAHVTDEFPAGPEELSSRPTDEDAAAISAAREAAIHREEARRLALIVAGREAAYARILDQ